ncbi:uncharacterized protein LOC120204345 [Hibiscus syriacus]|uniref:uncharacterized protein LOC120204345 n=1 Tax=Hibiscus syriacus TaxID=106335 RepID=UPI001922FACF|nr:uncharacterized protein LOC120204345 [Hibiscus syriacus]
MVKGYGRKTISPRCSMKIDLHKAFDSLDWRFISVVLKAIQLPHQFIAWIEECFTQARYSIAFNGTLIGYFKGARGLRQGNVESVVGILSVLDQFHQISGLKLNSSKSELFAAGIPNGIMDKIKRISGFKIGSLHVKYLGIPLVSRKLTDKDCEALITNIKQKLQSWWSNFAPVSSGNELIERLLELEKILAGNDSLWVAWLNSFVLKNQDFWLFQAGANVSWSIKRILKLRTTSSPFLTAGLQPKEIWEISRTHEQKVSWHRLIWFPLHIPKHSLLAWMVLPDSLPTRDHLQRMGICSEGICINYNLFQESRDHIFFHCPLAAELWSSILQLTGMNSSFMSWDDFIVSACSTWKGKSLITVLLKLAWSAFIYFLWQERNNIIFLGHRRSVEALLEEIKNVVGIRLRGKSINRLDSINLSLCSAWNIT